MKPSDPVARFFAKLALGGPAGACWVWTAALRRDGYAHFYVNRITGKMLAHRYSWQLATGSPIPPGLQLDHLCRTRHCVRPTHLQPVTQRENILRGESPSANQARQARCIRGHEFTPENTRRYRYGSTTHRQCAICQAMRNALRYAKEST